MKNLFRILIALGLVAWSFGQVAPVISVQPQPVVVTAGQTATFSVTASGSSLTFQWRRNGMPIASATQQTFTVAGASRSDADIYDVLVSSGGVSTASSPVRLSVAPTSYPTIIAPDSGWNLDLAGYGAVGYATASLPDGRAYLGGAFVSVNGTRRTGVLRVLGDGSVDSSFAAIEFENQVRSLLVQADGKLLVGGDFTRVGGLARARLVRLNSDGSLDGGFGNAAGVNDSVLCMAVQADGKVLIGGNFSSVFGSYRSRLARLNADGTVDPSFIAHLNSTVNAIAVQADGKVVVGGTFNTHTDALGAVLTRSGLLRLNADGSADSSFNPSVSGPVWSLALQSDGQILTHGQFGSYLFPNGDEWSNDVSGGIGMDRQNWSAGDYISCCQDSTGVNRSMQFELYVKSSVPFTTARNGSSAAQAAGSAAEIKAATGTNTNGIYWILVNGVATQVYCIMDSAIDGGGWMLAMKGASGAATFNYSSSHWTTTSTLNPTFLRGNGPSVNEDAKFDVFNYSPAEKVMAIFPDVSADRRGGAVSGQSYGFIWIENMPTPANTATYSGRPAQGSYTGKTLRELFTAEEKIFVRDATTASPYRAAGAGVFSSQAHVRFFGFNYRNASNSNRVRFGFGWNENGGLNYLARLKSDGSLDTAFQTALGTGFNGAVLRLAVQSDGKILAGGEFTTFNGANTAYVCRLNSDGTRDATWLPRGFDGRVRWLEMQASGRILAAGDFSNHRDAANASVARTRFARLNADGTLDSGVNLSPLNHGEVNASVVLPGGKLLVAGYFTRARGAAVSNGIMRVNTDGSVDTSFNAGGVGANGRVMTVARQGDGKIVIGGAFTSYNGVGRDGVARLNADGTLDTGFNTAGTGGRDVYTVASLPGGGVVVGGTFTTFQGVSRNRIAVLNANGTVSTAFNPEAGCNDTVTTIFPLSGGQFLASGGFTTYNGTTVGRIVRLNGDGSIDTSFNAGGSGADGPVNTMAVHADGKISIGGWFGSYNSVGRGYVARLNGDGTLDTGFGAAPLNWGVCGLMPQEDGKLLIRGLFFSWSNPLSGRLYRLNSDGTLDTTFAIAGLNEGSPFPNMLAMTDGGQLAFGASNSPAFVMTRASGPPTITTQPVAQVATQGGTASFTVAASSNLPVSYQWYRDGMAVPGATNATLSLTNVQVAQTGSYRAYISNEFGGGFSTAATLSGTGTAPVITVQPQAVAVTTGQTATFSVTASGGPLAYQWRRNGMPIAAGTQATLTLSGVSRAEADSYDVVVSSGLMATVSNTVRLTVAPTSYPTIIAPDSGWNLELAGYGAAGYVTASLPDGRAYLGGAFVSVNGVRRTGVVRVLADGTLDSTFTPVELENMVRALWVQADGKLVVGGDFVRAGGLPRARLVRLNTDGSLDASFGNASGVNGRVNVVTAQADGKLLVGGDFSSVFGSPRNRLVRLNADGTVDASFTANLNSSVLAIAVQADGKVLAGGAFTTHTDASGVVTNRTRLVRLNVDGTVDAGFAPMLDNNVQSVAVQTDGQILVGGDFVNANGVAANRLVRLKADGTNDAAFLASLGSGLNGAVARVVVLADGRVLLAGGFGTLNGVNAAYACRLNGDGTRDATWVPQGFDGFVRWLEVQASGRILAAGDFSNHRDAANASVARSRFARLNADGTLDSGVNLTPLNYGEVNASVVLPGGKLLVAGYFTRARGAAVSNGIMRVNADGSVDTSFNAGGVGANGRVMAVARQGDGKIVIGGAFTNYNGVGRDGVARLNADGTLDTGFNTAGTGGRDVITVASLPGGGVVVGGSFTTFQGVSRNRIAVLNSDGTLNTNFNVGTGCNSTVTSIGVLPDGRSLVAGEFSSYNGSAVGRIMRLSSNGSLDQAFNAGGSGANSTIQVMLVHPDGKISIGGWLGTYNGVSRGYVARLNPDGTLDAGFAPVSLGWAAYGMLLQEDGKLLLRGLFGNVGSVANTARLVRLNADGSVDPTFAIAGLNEGTPSPNALAMTDGGQLAFGASNSPAFVMTRASGPPTITTQPVAQVATQGGAASFTVAASSNLPVSYQWYRDGMAVPGATNATLTLANVQPVNSGSYRAYVSNEFGGVFSAAASLAGTGAAPAITVQPISIAVTAGQAATFSVTASGGSLAYQWRRNGLPLAGATLASLNLGAASRTLADVYDVVISSGLSSTVSQPVRLSVAPSSSGQTLSADPSFAPTFETAGGSVRAMLRLPSGKLVVVGGFSSLGGVAARNVARLNADLSVDTSFVPPSINSTVNAVAVQSDGMLVIGGAFSAINGLTRSGVARLNPDGSLDTSFVPAITYATTNALVIQGDGRIIIGNGSVTSGYTYLARLNSDGSHDASFTPSLNGSVTALALQADGKLVVGGNFTSVASVSANRIVRLLASGEVDSTFGVGTGFNGSVGVLALLSDGRLLVGGSFTTYKDQAANRVIRLSVDGAVDAAWQPGTGPSGTVNSIVPAPDGSVWVGGSFSSFDGATRGNLARLLAGGALDAAFVPPAINSTVVSLQTLPDGSTLVGGSFSNVAGRDAFGLVRIGADAAVPVSPFDPALKSAGSVVRAIPLGGGKILAAGSFTHVNGVRSPHIARLTASGALDSTFNPGGTGPSASILDAAVQADGKILIMGSFVLYNGVSRTRVARLTADGALDSGFDPGVGPNTTAVRIHALSGGRSLLIGSTGLTSYSGLPRTAIIRINPDGSADPSFDAGILNGTVNTAAVQSDGRLVIGGTFTTIAGVQRNRIARLETSGAVDGSFAASADSSVSAVAIQSDGRVLVGGAFGAVNDLARTRVARLLANGAVDTDWDESIGPNSTVSDIVSLEDGRSILRGAFSTISGRPVRYVARLSARGALDASLGVVNLAAVPAGLAILDDGALLLFGGNMAVRDVDRLGLMRTLSTAAPEIVVAPSGNFAINAGTSLTLNAQVAGGGNVTFQWRRNGAAIPGANASSFTLYQAVDSDGGAYSVEVAHANGSAVSSNVNVSVTSVAPLLGTSQISSFAGSFSSPVIKAGSVYPLIAPIPLAAARPLSYQWFKDGTALTGATGPSFSPGPWQSGDSGSYSVRISNSAGSATTPAVLQRVSTAADWNPRFPLPQNNSLSNVAFLGGRFVAIGARGTLMTSSDGKSWSVVRLGASESSGVIGYGNGTYVAVFSPGSVYTSADAVNWTRRVTLLGVDGRSVATGPNSLIFAAGRFVAVGALGLVATSTDGIAWTIIPTGTKDGLFSVAYGAGRFVATAALGRTLYSTDGLSWSPGPVLPESVSYVEFGGGVFVAGSTNYVYRSPDGIAWSRKALPTTASIRGIHYTPQGFVAMLSTLSPGEYVVSTDGSAWTKRQMNLNLFSSPVSLAFGAGQFVAVGSAPETILNSSDGLSWSRTGPATSFSFRAVAARQSTAVAVGSSGTIYSSPEGLTWTARASGTTSQLNDVAATSTGFVAAGDSGVLLYSADGVSWSSVTSGTGSSLRGITAVNGRFIAVGDGGSVTLSVDGQSWTPVPSGVTQSLYKVAFGAGVHVAVGSGGAFATSIDGAAWIAQTASGTSTFVDVVYDRGLFVAVATDGRIRTSADGLSWAERTNPVGVGLGAVACVNGRFHALSTGSTTYLVSDDGITWDVAQHGVANVLNDVISYGGYPLAVGNAGTIVAPAVPVVTNPTANREIAYGATAVLSVEVAGNGPFSYQWQKNGSAIATATNSTLTLPSVSAADAGTYSILVSNSNGSSLAIIANVSVLPPVAPAITLHPQSQAVSEGASLSLSVGVSGSAPLSYQWYRNDAPLVGKSTASLVVAPFASTDVGSYRVRISNIAGLADSRVAFVTIMPAGLSATHTAVGGYVPGGTATISSTITYSGTASSLGWQVLIPEGWTYLSGGGAEGDVKPSLGTSGALEWAWSNPGASPVTFTYTMNVPSGQTGEQALAALAIVRLVGASSPYQFLAKPDPLTVSANPYHSADTDRNYRISLLELTRVIELYNTRNGTTRTGCYAVATTATEDGFAIDAARSASAVVTLARYHSADSVRDGKISLLELTRVIELYNYRSGTTRTGQYKVQAGTEDGFAPGP